MNFTIVFIQDISKSPRLINEIERALNDILRLISKESSKEFIVVVKDTIALKTIVPGDTKNTILEYNIWWALLFALFGFMAKLAWFILNPESGIYPDLIDGIVNTLESITNLVINSEISKETAQLFLDALNQLSNQLPGIIDFLKNITINHNPIFEDLANTLKNVVLPMIEWLIKIIIEYIRSR
jgi:hypothetical protein